MICRTQRSRYLVDQVIWNYIGADQSTSFGTFVDSFDFEQELSNIEYENGKTLPGGVYWRLQKGVKFAKKLKRDGDTHWNNPQQWDVGEYKRFDPCTFDFPPVTYGSVIHAELEKYTPANLEKLLVNPSYSPMYRNMVGKVLEKKVTIEKEKDKAKKIAKEKEKPSTNHEAKILHFVHRILKATRNSLLDLTV